MKRSCSLMAEWYDISNWLAVLLQKKPFDAANFAAGGLAYALDYSIAQTYNAAYEESPVAASTAIAETMNQVSRCTQPQQCILHIRLHEGCSALAA